MIETRVLRVNGDTCERCGDTVTAARQATERLQQGLAQLGVPVTLVEHAADADEVDQSNTVLVNGVSVEEWLGASRVETDCPSCGDLIGENTCCGAMSLGGVVHESLTADHIMSASLIALGLMGPSQGCC